jgi:hypothetical protein
MTPSSNISTTTSASTPSAARVSAAASVTGSEPGVGHHRRVPAGAAQRAAGDVDGAAGVPLCVVERAVLEDDHRVRIVQRGAQHPARVLHRCGREHLQPRHVGVPALQAVRVLGGELAPRAARHADHDRDAELAARHVRDRSPRC